MSQLPILGVMLRLRILAADLWIFGLWTTQPRNAYFFAPSPSNRIADNYDEDDAVDDGDGDDDGRLES